ncbi:MAG: response regulator [Spirochaetales bacterium]|nr:response regulator [Spirochaetales bacterium]
MKKILVIDDSKAACSLVVSLLESLEAEIYTAISAEDGLLLIGKQQFDLIITDLEMTGMSGIELCREIRMRPEFHGIPVIVLSVFDTEDAIEKSYRAGAEAYIAKNQIKRSLLKTAKQVMAKARLQRGKKILVADDSMTIRDMVETGLCEEGFDVTCVNDGNEAYLLLQKEQYDLVLTDIEMPKVDGFKLLELIYSDPDLATVPVVVMSTHDERSYIKRIMLQGAVSYLVKPFVMDQLVSMVERVLSDRFILIHKEKERADMERKLILASITSLISALEARDNYTRGHSEEVSVIASGMLSIFGATEKQLDDITMAGKLHDIGKIGVPDSVLLKPGALTEEEFNQVKRHPVTGAAILDAIPSLYNVIPVVRYHHERFDGKGYPDGLSGREIPFWARITSVADTFHALTSDRPYRKGMSIDQAAEIIREVSGTQLCPECVNLFFQWLGTRTSQELHQVSS